MNHQPIFYYKNSNQQGGRNADTKQYQIKKTEMALIDSIESPFSGFDSQIDLKNQNQQKNNSAINEDIKFLIQDLIKNDINDFKKDIKQKMQEFLKVNQDIHEKFKIMFDDRNKQYKQSLKEMGDCVSELSEKSFQNSQKINQLSMYHNEDYLKKSSTIIQQKVQQDIEFNLNTIVDKIQNLTFTYNNQYQELDKKIEDLSTNNSFKDTFKSEQSIEQQQFQQQNLSNSVERSQIQKIEQEIQFLRDKVLTPTFQIQNQKQYDYVDFPTFHKELDEQIEPLKQNILEIQQNQIEDTQSIHNNKKITQNLQDQLQKLEQTIQQLQESQILQQQQNQEQNDVKSRQNLDQNNISQDKENMEDTFLKIKEDIKNFNEFQSVSNQNNFENENLIKNNQISLTPQHDILESNLNKNTKFYSLETSPFNISSPQKQDKIIFNEPETLQNNYVELPPFQENDESIQFQRISLIQDKNNKITQNNLESSLKLDDNINDSQQKKIQLKNDENNNEQIVQNVDDWLEKYQEHEQEVNNALQNLDSNLDKFKKKTSQEFNENNQNEDVLTGTDELEEQNQKFVQDDLINKFSTSQHKKSTQQQEQYVFQNYYNQNSDEKKSFDDEQIQYQYLTQSQRKNHENNENQINEQEIQQQNNKKNSDEIEFDDECGDIEDEESISNNYENMTGIQPVTKLRDSFHNTPSSKMMKHSQNNVINLSHKKELTYEDEEQKQEEIQQENEKKDNQEQKSSFQEEKQDVVNPLETQLKQNQFKNQEIVIVTESDLVQYGSKRGGENYDSLLERQAFMEEDTTKEDQGDLIPYDQMQQQEENYQIIEEQNENSEQFMRNTNSIPGKNVSFQKKKSNNSQNNNEMQEIEQDQQQLSQIEELQSNISYQVQQKKESSQENLVNLIQQDSENQEYSQNIENSNNIFNKENDEFTEFLKLQQQQRKENDSSISQVVQDQTHSIPLNSDFVKKQIQNNQDQNQNVEEITSEVTQSMPGYVVEQQIDQQQQQFQQQTPIKQSSVESESNQSILTSNLIQNHVQNTHQISLQNSPQQPELQTQEDKEKEKERLQQDIEQNILRMSVRSNRDGQASEADEELVYELDENGFLMDEKGNYILDDNDEMIQLGQEHINYLKESQILQEEFEQEEQQY